MAVFTKVLIKKRTVRVVASYVNDLQRMNLLNFLNMTRIKILMRTIMKEDISVM